MSVLLHISHIPIEDQNFGTNRFRLLFPKSVQYLNTPFLYCSETTHVQKMTHQIISCIKWLLYKTWNTSYSIRITISTVNFVFWSISVTYSTSYYHCKLWIYGMHNVIASATMQSTYHMRQLDAQLRLLIARHSTEIKTHFRNIAHKQSAIMFHRLVWHLGKRSTYFRNTVHRLTASTLCKHVWSW
jgi:hypothetical protein